VQVERRTTSASVVISHCPEDPLYSELLFAMLRALLYGATGVERTVSVQHQSHDELSLRVGGLDESPPSRPSSRGLTYRNR
jgi:hypothetical protein